jgi:HAD superfamily hydrolase (TIGR01549 family)
MRCVVFDLDDTLVDTRPLRHLREARKWRDAIQQAKSTTVFPGIPVLLEGLRSSGVRIAIVTTSVSAYAHAILRNHSITYDQLIAYHDAPPKPSAEGVIKILKTLGIPAEESVGIGDNISDLRAYRSAGIYAIGAGWSPVLAIADWDVVIDRPQAILPIERER